MPARSLVVRALLVALLLPLTMWHRCACTGNEAVLRLTVSYHPSDGRPLGLNISGVAVVGGDAAVVPLSRGWHRLRFAAGTGEEKLLLQAVLPPGRYQQIRLRLEGRWLPAPESEQAVAPTEPFAQAFVLDSDLALRPGTFLPLLLQLRFARSSGASGGGAQKWEAVIEVIPRDRAAKVVGVVGPLPPTARATVSLARLDTGAAVTVQCTPKGGFTLIVPAGGYLLTAAAPERLPFRWPAFGVAPNEVKRVGPVTLMPAIQAADSLDPRLFFSPPRESRRLVYMLEQQLPGLFPIIDALGVGGAVTRMHPQQGGRYLLEQAGWADMGRRLLEARRRGMRVWIYDELSYPSGYAGGLTLEGHPELQAQGVFAYSFEAAPPQFDQPLPSGRLLRAVAFRKDRPGASLGQVLDLTQHARAGRLTWAPPPGSWQVMAFVQQPLAEGTHAQETCGPYPNLLDPRALQRFLQLTHEQYYARFPQFFGKEIEAFFNDEPSLQSGFTSKGPAPAIPWVDDLPEQFRARSGRDLLEVLPALFAEMGSETTSIRCAFYSLISDLVVERYFAPLSRWCEEHGVHNATHLFDEESLVAHAVRQGNAFAAYAAMSWPGIDYLGTGVGGYENRMLAPKTASSAAHLYGKQGAWSECWAIGNPLSPLDSLLGSLAWQAVLGVDTFVTMPPLNEDFPGRSPEEYYRLNNYAGRLSYVLAGSQHQCQVAMLYPIASVWASYIPTRGSALGELSPQAETVSNVLASLSHLLASNQIDFDYLDEGSLRRARIEDGTISIGDHRFRYLVLPGASVLSRASVQCIDRFLAQGGQLIIVGDPPSQSSERGPDGWAAFRTAGWLGRPGCSRVPLTSAERGGPLPPLQAPNLPTDLRRAVLDRLPRAARILPSERGAEHILAKRGARGGRPFLMLFNATGDPFDLRLACPFSGPVEQWDPDSGQVRRVQLSSAGELSLRLPGYGATFLVGEAAQQAVRSPSPPSKQ